MNKTFGKYYHFLFLLLIGLFVSSAHAAPKSYNSDMGYQGNSWMEYEEFQQATGYDDCFSSGKVFSDPSALSNTSIPYNIGRNVANTAANNVQGKQFGSQVGRAVGYSLIGAASLGIGLIIAAVDYAVMVDVCSNSYVMSAAEQVTVGAFPTGKTPGKVNIPASMNKNVCTVSGGVVSIDPKTLGKSVYSSNEIPYLFHCDPYYDPATGGKTSDPALIGRTYGYAGGTSASCTLGLNQQTLGDIKKNIGTITVGYWPKISRGWNSAWGGDSVCRLDKHSLGAFKAGDEGKVGIVDFYAFYWQQPRTGKIRLCAIAPYTMFPVLAGCGTVAPPVDLLNTDDFIKNYVAGTRCAYLLKSRDDLHALGTSGIVGANTTAISKFLQSDLHVMSTVVGCIKDMLQQIFITAPNAQGPTPFFTVVQQRMKQMVMAVLVLYVSLVGIKIMTAGQPPSRGEAVMYVVKLALVVYFAILNGWTQTGLFPGVLDVAEDLSDIFLEAQTVNDPMSTCYASYKNSNVFSNQSIASINGISTEGSKGFIKTTVWDLVDCKVINYMTLGTCNYSLSGLMSLWLFSGLIFTDFALAVVCFIYSLMVLMTVFRFAHIYILSIFTLTILIFLSPIFICFGLFEPTKGMFQKWMQMIIGYMLYPALLFAFVAIMFATFDSVYYGNLNLPKNGQAIQGNLKGICTSPSGQDVESIFCKNLDKLNYNDPCSASPSTLSTNLITSTKIPAMGDIKSVDSDYSEKIRSPMLRLMLFAFLFYLFLGSVSEFMAVLVGVQGLGDVAQGLGAGLKPLTMAAGAAAKGGASALANKAASGAGKIAGNIARRR